MPRKHARLRVTPASRWRRTLKGKLYLTYSNMTKRVTGKANRPAKDHIYLGLPICTKDEFYTWALNDEAYRDLHTEWVLSGFLYALSPSISRIDHSGGYLLGNMEWRTHGDNSREVNQRRVRCPHCGALSMFEKAA